MALFVTPPPAGAELSMRNNSTRTQELCTRRGRYEVFIAGDPTGPTIHVCHGLPGSALAGVMPLYTDHPAESFSRDVWKQGYNIVCIGRGGYGATTAIPERSVADTGRDMLYALRCLGVDEFSVLGRSAGGAYACALACAALSAGEDMPRVTRLALLAPGAPVRAFASTDQWLVGFSTVNRHVFEAALKGDERTVRAHYSKIYLALKRNPYALVMALYKDPETPSADREILGSSFAARTIGQGHAAGMQYGIEGSTYDAFRISSDWEGVDFPLLRRIQTRILYAPDDPFAPASHALGLAALIGNATLERQEGHLFAYRSIGKTPADYNHTVAREVFRWLSGPRWIKERRERYTQARNEIFQRV